MTTTPRTLEELAAAVDAKLALAKAAQDAFVAANDSAQTAARARAAAVNEYEHAWAEHQAALAGLPLLWAERRVRHWDDPANDYVPVLVRSVSRVSPTRRLRSPQAIPPRVRGRQGVAGED